jgi:anti-sigma-K factor RskA
VEIKDIISSGLLELHVLGMTTPAEAAEVEAWVMKYPEVRSEMDAIELAMEEYALANAIEPGTGLKDRILSGTRGAVTHMPSQQPAPAKVVGIAPFWKYLAAASVLLLIGSVLLNLNYQDKLQKADQALADTKNELIAANGRLDTMSADMSVVQNKYSQAVSLNGLPAAPDAAAKIFWMKNTGEVYIDPSNLPEAPAGKQYQLWAIVDGKPVDGGMIITTKKDNKYRIQKMKTFGKAEAFAVTLETEGGNPTPKGDMYVLGKM